VTIADDTLFKSHPAVAYAPGQSYLVSWTVSTDANIYARRVGADGVPRGPANGFPITACAGGLPFCRHSRVAYAPAFGFLVTWAYFNGMTPDVGNVYARLVRPGQDAPNGAAFAIDASANYQASPDVACAGGSPRSACLVVEEHCPSAGGCANLDIRGRLVKPWLSELPVVRK
jgi:hypothetical protein